MVSIIGIIGTFSIVIVFLLCFGLTLNSYLKNPNSTKILFMIWSISVSLTYLSWGLRVLLIPQLENDINILYPYFACAYGFGGLALIFLDFATLNLTRMKKSTLIKLLRIIILISFIIVIIAFTIGFETGLTTFMDVSDLKILNPFVYYYFTFIILFYVFFPNAIFIKYLIEAPSKTDPSYKRIRIIEVGILLFSISIALDGIRLPSNIGILIIRLILMIGGLIIMKGFLLKQSSE